MSKIFIEDTTLSAIGNAIREKTGSSDLINPLDMPSAIGSIETGGGGDAVNELNYRGQYFTTNAGSPFAYNIFNNLIDGKSFTINLTNVGTQALFYYSNNLVDLSKVVINVDGNNYGYNSYSVFECCAHLEHLPKLNVISGINSINACNTFRECYRLRYIDEDFWREYWKQVDTSSTEIRTQSQFYCCASLRETPDMTIFDNFSFSSTSVGRMLYYELFGSCYSLDTIEYLPVINTTNNITSNMFYWTFNDCCRVKDIIFATDNGTPYVRNWRNQTIDLSNYTGYASSYGYITSEERNSGITTDKWVTDNATYQALKNDPDWWSDRVAYSRYNHDSAVRTINSLPDCSSGGSNTIKFKSEAGSATDGGAINTLTETEIAVAATKGWTVSIIA